jgi:hypothetical protein
MVRLGNTQDVGSGVSAECHGSARVRQLNRLPALAIGRCGAIAGPLLGGQLIKMGLPMQQLFLAASAPMVVGAVAAVMLVRMCYVRLGALRLSDVPLRRPGNGMWLPGSPRAGD